MIIYDTIAIALICTLFAEISGIMEKLSPRIKKYRFSRYMKKYKKWEQVEPEVHKQAANNATAGFSPDFTQEQLNEIMDWMQQMPQPHKELTRLKPLDCGLCLSFWSAILYCVLLQPSPMNCIFIIGGAPIASVIIYGICKRLL